MSHYNEFTLAFYVNDGQRYDERGQTVETMQAMIDYYLQEFNVELIEMWQGWNAPALVIYDAMNAQIAQEMEV